jgi:hypothetical protein
MVETVLMFRVAGTAAPRSFSEDDDDEELVLDLFAKIDTDQSKSLSKKELHTALDEAHRNSELVAAQSKSLSKKELYTALDEAHRNSELVAALQDLLSKSETLAEEISFDTFLKAFRQLPRVRGERVRWAATLRLEEVLARHLVKGQVFDGLKGLKDLTEEEAEAHVQDVCSKFSAELPGILKKALSKLREGQSTGSAAERHMNSKFVMEGAYVGCFATLNDFYKGPEALIGVPNPRIFEGAEKEHTLRQNAWVKFRTSNYGLETCSAIEWYFVVDPFGSKLDSNWLQNAKYPHTPKKKQLWNQEESENWLEKLLKDKKPNALASQGPENRAAEKWKGECGREPVPIDEFLSSVELQREVMRAGLRREECICLRLYSGPMFVMYNASLRGFPAADVAALGGNKFETTIFAITSGVTKLSKITGIPADRRLYRGLGGMVLPEHFWRAFPECLVTFHATANDLDGIKNDLDGIKAALGSKVEEHDTLKGKNCALKTKMLRLEGWTNLYALPSNSSGPSDIGAGPGQTAADVGGESTACDKEGQPSGEGRQQKADATVPSHMDGLVRVVAENRVVGDSVCMTVALPFSKYDFTDEMQLKFTKAVTAICGERVQVVVKEVADKPKDFKGGGVSSRYFTSPWPVEFIFGCLPTDTC